MLTIYTSAFNIIGLFDYEYTLDNFCNFAENVVIAVNKSKDNTLIKLQELAHSYRNLHIIESNISYSDPLLDGKVKNEGLKYAELLPGEYLCGLDLDEEIYNQDINKWVYFADLFIKYYNYEALLIPSVNLWGDRDSVRWDEQTNKAYKWYIHKKGLSRGPIKQGLTSDGFLDISVSDGAEIINKDMSLARTIRIDQDLDNITDCAEYYAKVKEQYPYIIHNSFLDFNKRLKKVDSFWKEQWKMCSNRENVDIIDKLEDFGKYKTEKHGLF